MADPTDRPEPRRVADTHCHTGEGPLYHPDEGVVYFLDIPEADLYRYDPADGSHERVLDAEGAVGGFTIQDSGDLLLFCDGGRIQPWNRDDGLGDPVVESIDGEGNSRFNDVIADPRGRVFCGTMPTPDGEPGTLYRLDTDGSLSVAVEDARLSNGLGFTPDRRHVYFTETEAGRISRYRYDQATGDLSDREPFLDASDLTGHPDGMTVDAEGHVWAAFWDGGRIASYDPEGTERQRVEFPAKKVSAVTFGGPDYDTAYVTTALGPGEGPASTREEEGDGAGALFAVDLGVGGVPEFRSRIETR
ncbi:SMP-30/gluconolaconase/LRE-like region-containing protein [Halosimplex carlsbadense 2-9-1]|uniref:SMP-30/gluconolaconase/LRE-like region-containing protein n=1 Tax=Halosimplex carlsbadense 2-9-1 TaxID=797114 RepID=M0CNY6_9EURY|nr:SMP-30/gluconolactonase/LRE family protein [Halosimplex carlsbadense]ELZ24102.1 SMP-30/gluconolaconase/LRE-like region-containing protein [Halosimplex carlsbadense 2-9-1]